MCMKNKRVIQIIIGSILGLYGVIVSLLTMYFYETIPVPFVVTGLVSGAIGTYLIVFGFLNFYN